nr:MAG TPA: Mitochondrial genome maintenance exonuclease 1, DNA complex, DNA exonuclease [Crassvirales sp.]
MYTKTQMLTKNEIDNTRRAISEIVTNEVPGPAVIAGQIVDEIGRAFFAEEELINKPEYKMTDAIFKDTVKEFEKIQAEFVKRGWVVDTTPYTWYFTAPNGQRVAGETDLIAIDKDGNIHVLDFKTTKNSSRFKLTR